MYRDEFERTGYTLVRGLFGTDEVDQLRDHYMELRHRGADPHDFAGHSATARDPLKRYPRMAQMHRWDEASLQLDDRPAHRRGDDGAARQVAVRGADDDLLQAAGLAWAGAAPGQLLSEGRAGHLRRGVDGARPGRRANGCLEVVPGSHRWPILCTEKADTTVSFTDVTVPLPRPGRRRTGGDGAGRRAVLPRRAGAREQPERHHRPLPAGADRPLHRGRGGAGSRSTTTRRCGWTAPSWNSTSPRAAARAASGPTPRTARSPLLTGIHTTHPQARVAPCTGVAVR